MDFYATLLTGIYWGLIADAIWMIPYFCLLYYHFWKMENDPLYPTRYEKNMLLIKEKGKMDAMKENFRKRGRV